MNRRNLLQTATGLIVGEPVHRAYSFLTNNPLAIPVGPQALQLAADGFTRNAAMLSARLYAVFMTGEGVEVGERQLIQLAIPSKP